MESKTIIELHELSEQFDMLGVPKLEFLKSGTINSLGEIISQLILRCYSLIGIQRELSSKFNELQLDNSQLQADYSNLKKGTIENVNVITEKNHLYNNQSTQLTLRKMEVDDLAVKNKELKTANEFLNNQLKSKEKEYKFSLKKQLLSYRDLQQSCTTKIDQYIDKDIRVARLIERYKLKEDVYEETISKLSRNNEVLLEELITIREQLSDGVR